MTTVPYWEKERRRPSHLPCSLMACRCPSWRSSSARASWWRTGTRGTPPSRALPTSTCLRAASHGRQQVTLWRCIQRPGWRGGGSSQGRGRAPCRRRRSAGNRGGRQPARVAAGCRHGGHGGDGDGDGDGDDCIRRSICLPTVRELLGGARLRRRREHPGDGSGGRARSRHNLAPRRHLRRPGGHPRPGTLTRPPSTRPDA